MGRVDSYVFSEGNDHWIVVPGISELPEHSPFLSAVIKRGVEVTSTGRVVGLINIWHWCGNDPVRRHVARVDVANALLYFGAGSVPADIERMRHRPGRSAITEYGWNISDSGQFLAFESALRRSRRLE